MDPIDHLLRKFSLVRGLEQSVHELQGDRDRLCAAGGGGQLWQRKDGD